MRRVLKAGFFIWRIDCAVVESFTEQAVYAIYRSFTDRLYYI